MRLSRAPPRSPGGVSPSQFFETRRQAVGDTTTSPAVAVRIKRAHCANGPPLRAAAAAASTGLVFVMLPHETASQCTSTSRSEPRSTRLTNAFSDSVFSNSVSRRSEQAARRKPFPSPSRSRNVPKHVVPTRISETYPNPTAAVTAIVTGNGARWFSSKSVAVSKSSSDETSPSSSEVSNDVESATFCEPPCRSDLYLASVAPALRNPDRLSGISTPSTEPEPSSTDRRSLPPRFSVTSDSPRTRSAIPAKSELERSRSADISRARHPSPPREYESS
mmetsp:Transcript_9912/g.32772  ORF Transcript_9912/g.32772 Transcript_9912/m.32772 type:complete len:277 (+) Transcript_9912:6982-7812(+)